MDEVAKPAKKQKTEEVKVAKPNAEKATIVEVVAEPAKKQEAVEEQAQ